MTSPPEHDAAGIYRKSRERLLDLMPTLTGTELATVVPTCPAWTVRDVVAHLSGVAADVLSGDLTVATPEATARQVAERTEAAIDEICAEWARNGPAIDALIESSGRMLTLMAFDCWTHDQDVHNALGIVSGREGPGLEMVANGIWRMKRIIRDQNLAPLRVVTGGHDWLIGDGEDTGATLRIETYELARMLVGRRSLDQMRSYEWEGDPEPYLDLIPAFEPPRAPIIE